MSCRKKIRENGCPKTDEEESCVNKRGLALEALYQKCGDIDFSKLSVVQLIYLYSLWYQSSCEDVAWISPLSSSPMSLTPSHDWDSECIHALVDYVAPFSEDDKLLKIDDQGEAEWYTHQVFYRIKIEERNKLTFEVDLLKYLNSMLKIKFNMSQFIDLSERLMISECIVYLGLMRSEYGLLHEVGDKTTSLFRKIIVNLRIDQIYTIIWKACKEAIAFRAKERVSIKHASNSIIGIIDKYVDQAETNKWPINSYYRKEGKQSAISYIVFNKILKMAGSGVEYNFEDVWAKAKGFLESEGEVGEIQCAVKNQCICLHD